MAIVKMNEFSLYFLKEDKGKILDELQAFGGLEFSDFEKYSFEENRDESLMKALENFKYLKQDDDDILNEQSLNKLKYCLEVMKPYVPKQSMLKSLTDDKVEVKYEDLRKIVLSSSWEKIYDDIKEINTKITSLDSDYLKCVSDIESNRCWENLSSPIRDYKNLKSVSCFFGNISRQFEQEIIEKFQTDFKFSSVDAVSCTQQDSFLAIIVHNDMKQEAVDYLRTKGFNFQVLDFDEKVSDYLRNLENRKILIINEKNKLLDKIKEYEHKYLDLQMANEFLFRD